MTILSYQEDSQTWLSYRDWSSLLTQSHLLPSLLGKCQVSPVVWTCTRRSNLLTLYKNKIGWIIVPLYKTGECDIVRAVIIGLHAFNHQQDKFCLQWYLEKLSCTKQHTEIVSFIFINPLTPKSDCHLISPDNVSPESNIEVMRIREMINNQRSLDC